tara:strand:- start:758 stop:1297 length:540 start_codon:yes stop_codon:yes gene_type:complete
METNFFENTQYKNKYARKSLMIDITVLQNTINYNVVLPEELKVDKFSEVFVDTVVTNNVVTNETSTGPTASNKKLNNIGMLLKIDKINTRTIGGDTTDSGTTNYNGRFFIPNEAGSNATGLKIHKGRKQNYLGTIEAGRYRNFNITLSDLDNSSIFMENPEDVVETSKFIIELIIVEKE